LSSKCPPPFGNLTSFSLSVRLHIPFFAPVSLLSGRVRFPRSWRLLFFLYLIYVSPLFFIMEACPPIALTPLGKESSLLQDGFLFPLHRQCPLGSSFSLHRPIFSQLRRRFLMKMSPQHAFPSFRRLKRPIFLAIVPLFPKRIWISPGPGSLLNQISSSRMFRFLSFFLSLPFLLFKRLSLRITLLNVLSFVFSTPSSRIFFPLFFSKVKMLFIP